MSYTIAQVSNATLESLTVAELIDYHLEHNPKDTFTVFPGEHAGDEPSRISFLEFGRASHRFARAIYPDAPVKEKEVVGIMMTADSLMWITALAGMIRAGVTAFPISPRNSSTAICHVLRTVSSHRLIVTESSLDSLVNDVKAELASSDYDLNIHELPSLSDIYPHLSQESQDDAFEPILLSSRTESPDDAVLYIRSSGSTGLPKSVPLTNELFSKLTYDALVEPWKDWQDPYFLATPGLPDFHLMGVWMHFAYPLYAGRPSGIFRPTYPQPPLLPSPATILAALKELKPTATITIPSILESWARDPEAVKYLKTLDNIRFGGGPLSTAIGDTLVEQGCQIRSAYGSTEAGFVSAGDGRHLASEDWAWCEINPNVNVRWRPAGDGAFELEVLRGTKHIVSVENLSDVRGYATQDLWEPHPTKPGLWKIVGRVDDVLILANGEKVVPAPIEGAVLAHSAVRGVVAFGRERTQIGLLVEPAENHTIDPADERALAAFRNKIWNAVEAANRDSPAFGRVYKEMVLVTSPNKPLPRAAKGTIQKKAAVKLYNEEIQALYESIEHPVIGSGVQSPSRWTLQDVSTWLSSIAAAVLGKDVEPDVDLFAQGFDSLSATFLRNNILGALRDSTEHSVARAAQAIDNNFAYTHPTLSDMSAAIMAAINPEEGTKVDDPTVAIRAMIDRYSTDLPDVQHSNEPKPGRHVVLLTGSTRGLGSQLLATMLKEDQVERVYALNRPLSGKTSQARHVETFRDRELDEHLLESVKLVLLEGETSHEHFDLPAELYEEISKSVTIIIHNAWRLDFNLSLSSFESAIRGTRNLLDLAMTSSHASHVRMMFTSSVAVTQSWPRNGELFPEEPQANARWCVGNGYGESKYVCEQLLARAADHGLQTTSFRIGQICGSQDTGTWAVTDWVALMIRSSVELGCLPEAMGVMSWIAPEAVSGAILDVAFGEEQPERALNVVHPRPITWSTMIEAAADELVHQQITGDRLPVVTMSDWYTKLAEAAVDADEGQIKRIPALKLLDFFRHQAQADVTVRAAGAIHGEASGLTALSLTKVQQASRTMRELEPLKGADVGRWVGYWKSKGLFNDQN